MAIKPLHIIRKQVFEITLPDFDAAVKWEVNDRQQVVESVRSEMERCFGEHDDMDNHLIIEKLDLDLGIFTSAGMLREIPVRFYSEFQKILLPHIEKSMKATPCSYNGNGELTGYQPLKRDNTRLYSDSGARLESLFHFLRNGYLLWWASGIADWDEQWLEKLTSDEWKRIKQFLSTNGKIAPLRLVTQFSDEFLAALIKGLDVRVNTFEAWRWLLQMISNLPEDELYRVEKTNYDEDRANKTSPLREGPIQLQILRQRYWYQCILHALGKTSFPYLHLLLDRHPNILSVIKILLQKKEFFDTHFSSFGEIPSFWKQELEEQYKAEDVNRKEGEESNEPMSVLKASDEHKESTTNTKDLYDESDDIIIATEAGLVLLHPFLQQLFCNCGWMDKQEFSDSIAPTQAVYALYYLATGKTEAPEHQLLLPKLLCGMPWEIPLEPVIPLIDTQKIVCEELLIAVIKHWNALGNTSPDGLREGYLQRTGKLEPLPGEWRLQVEYKTQDILLNRIPWSISKIKLPWMTSMLSVIWK